MNRISELRKKHGHTQDELARRLHIAQNTLSQYENEQRTPTSSIIIRIANIYSVSTNYVLGLPEPADTTPPSGCGIDYPGVTKIRITDNENDVNIHIAAGYRLLHVGTEAAISEDGSGYSKILFTLGWYGDPSSAPVLNTAKDDVTVESSLPKL